MAKKSLKQRLAEKAAELKAKGGQGNIFYLKADTTVRVRILNMGEEAEFIKEIEQFYLGGDIKGVISPATFSEPCALAEGYDELVGTGEEDDKKLAEKLNRRKRYLAYCAIYKDTKGKELDDRSPRFVLLTEGQYQAIIDLYLDEDDWGDMTDPIKGYDLKLKRTGSGKMDTEYFVTACPKTKAPEKFREEVYDLDAEVRKIMPTYEQTKEYLDKFLGMDISREPEEEDDDMAEKPEKKKVTGINKSKLAKFKKGKK